MIKGNFIDNTLLISDLLIAAVIILMFMATIAVRINASGKTYDDVDLIPHNRVGILLGSGPQYKNGDVSYTFKNRMTAAAELYHHGKIDKIVATGGDFIYEGGSDQPIAMRDSLIKLGVPEDKIILDYEGIRTFNSVLKAKEIYGLDSVTFISQADHNCRSIWLAEHFGISAIGYNAKENEVLSRKIGDDVHEYPARVKMFIDILTGLHPKFDPSTPKL